MRAVFDTNTVVSALFWRGPPHNALNAIRAKQATLIASEVLLNELEDALSKQKFVVRLEQLGLTPQQLVAMHRDLVETVEFVALENPVSRDVDDDNVLACAVAGKADAIVSGDNDLLVLKEYRGIPIWTAVTFVEALHRENSES